MAPAGLMGWTEVLLLPARPLGLGSLLPLKPARIPVKFLKWQGRSRASPNRFLFLSPREAAPPLVASNNGPMFWRDLG